MPGEDITFHATGIDEIEPVDNNTIKVSLEGVDLSRLVDDITPTVLLDEIGKDVIEAYLESLNETDE